MKKNNALIIKLLFITNIFNFKSDANQDLEISFDKIFPETKIEQFHRELINLSLIIDNFDNKNSNLEKKLLEKNLIDNLMNLYAISYCFKDNIKKSDQVQKQVQKNDLYFFEKLINQNKILINSKLKDKLVDHLNFMFDKLLLNIETFLYHQI